MTVVWPKWAFVFVLIGAGGAGTAQAERTLSAEEIRAAFSDKTLLGENYGKRMQTRIYSGPSGEWWSQPKPGVIHKFTWQIDRAGYHCKAEDGGTGCGPIVSRGEPNVYYKFLNGRERFKFTVLGDGNQLR